MANDRGQALGPVSKKIQDNIQPLLLSRLQQDSAEDEARPVYGQECEDTHKLRHKSLLAPALEPENSRELITFLMVQVSCLRPELFLSMDLKLLSPQGSSLPRRKRKKPICLSSYLKRPSLTVVLSNIPLTTTAKVVDVRYR